MPDGIIDLIYDAIVDDGAVPQLAQAIAGHLRADTSWILVGVGADAPPAATCIHGIDDDIVHAYEDTYYRYDPWMDLVSKIPQNAPLSLDRWVSTQQFQNSLAYQDLVRGRVDMLHCLGLLVRTGTMYSSVALQRGRRGVRFDEDDEKRLTPYVEHLRRFATATIRKATIAPLCLETLISHPDPVIVVDHNAFPVHCSAEGAALLESRTVLTRTAGGRLHSMDRQFYVEASVRDAALRGVPTVRQIDPPCGSHFIAVDPCHALPRHATITVRDQAAHARRTVESAARRFLLTEAETGLTTSLVTGLTLEEHCLCHDIAVSTARSQLKSIFDKANVRRQSDLIRLVLAPPAN